MVETTTVTQTLKRNMNANDYLMQFFAELERLVDGHGTRHTISTPTQSKQHSSSPRPKDTFPPISDHDIGSDFLGC
jgi:hypothetical protein